jgi:hypothetical protein
MRIRIYFLMFCIFSLLSSLVLSELIEVPSEKWMNSNDININIELENDKYRPGDSVYFRLNITNNNEIPLSGGEVKVQIYYIENNNTKYLLNELILKEDIYLNINETKVLAGFWDVPHISMKGNYMIKVDYNSYQINYLEHDLISDNVVYFEVTNGPYLISLDVNNININNNKINLYESNNYLYELNQEINVIIPLSNRGYGLLTRITYDLYNYNNYNEEPLIFRYREDVRLNEDSIKNIKFNFTPELPGEYVLKIHVDSEKNNNLLSIKLPVKGETIKVNNLGLNKFPILQNEKIILFTCLSSLSQNRVQINLGLINDNKEIIYLESLDNVNLNQIPSCYETSFIANKDYEKLVLFSKVIDSLDNEKYTEIIYKSSFEQKRETKTIIILIILLTLLISIFVYYYSYNLKGKNK